MKTALVTTTINVPTVLKLYRACSPDVYFFIAGDRKTPTREIEAFFGDPEESDSLGNYTFMGIDYQHRIGHKCSELLGENTIGRRSIAILEALRWGAELIVTIDDDNIPMPSRTGYFHNFTRAFHFPFDGLCVDGTHQWFDVGTLLDPVAPHRGFPAQTRSADGFQAITGAKVGVAAGICLGDPDISAITRIANAPTVHRVSEVLRAGIVLDPRTHATVFNSQNTAFIRELASCFLMVPQFGRYDDIFASLVAQRVMRERNLLVHFGQPFVWQQRNSHDLLKDLRAEMFGQQYVVEFAQALDRVDISGLEPIEATRVLYASLATLPWMPAGVGELAEAWCRDCEALL